MPTLRVLALSFPVDHFAVIPQPCLKPEVVSATQPASLYNSCIHFTLANLRLSGWAQRAKKKQGPPGLYVDTSPRLEAGLFVRCKERQLGPILTWPGDTLVHLLSLSAGRPAGPSP